MEKLEVERFVQNQTKLCEHLLNEYIEGNFTDVQCPPSFDGILCWPSTLAPAVAVITCPPKIFLGYRNPDNPIATKTCLADGRWYRNEQQVTWTNYTLCIPPDGDYVTEPFEDEIGLQDETITNSTTLIREWLPFISTASRMGKVSSFTSLLVAMIVFSLLRRLRNPRNRLHMHLFASFIMKDFMALLIAWLFVGGVAPPWDLVSINGKNYFLKDHKLWVCKAITSVWEYFILTNYAWIFMEGLYLHNLVFLELCTDTPPITKYALWGWVLPSLVVVMWIVARALLEDTLCWTTHDNPSVFLIIQIPIIFSSLCNFILFINTVRVLLVKMKTSVHLQRKKMQYGRWAKSTLLLVPVFGIHSMLLLGLSYHKDIRVVLIWIFFDQLFGAFQGCFVACLYCLLNGEVRAEVARAWKTWRDRRNVDLIVLSNRKDKQIDEPQLASTTQSSNFSSKTIEIDDGLHENADPNVTTLK